MRNDGRLGRAQRREDYGLLVAAATMYSDTAARTVRLPLSANGIRAAIRQRRCDAPTSSFGASHRPQTSGNRPTPRKRLRRNHFGGRGTRPNWALCGGRMGGSKRFGVRSDAENFGRSAFAATPRTVPVALTEVGGFGSGPVDSTDRSPPGGTGEDSERVVAVGHPFRSHQVMASRSARAGWAPALATDHIGQPVHFWPLAV